MGSGNQHRAREDLSVQLHFGFGNGCVVWLFLLVWLCLLRGLAVGGAGGVFGSVGCDGRKRGQSPADDPRAAQDLSLSHPPGPWCHGQPDREAKLAPSTLFPK